MGRIVAAYGVSHTEMMIRKHSPGQPHHEAIHAAFSQVRAELAALAPDVVVMVGSDHLQSHTYACFPQVCVGFGDHSEGIGDGGLGKRKVPLAGQFGEALLERAVHSGIDLAFTVNPRLDHGFMAPLDFVDPDGSIPLVPVFQNAATPPLTPLHRSAELGRALREVVDARPKGERIALIGTGGLSHWIATPRMGRINQDFDARFLEMCRAGALEEMVGLDIDDLIEEAGNGAPEIRNWITVLAAAGGHGTVLAYEPVHEWATGIGIVRFDTAEGDR